MPIDLEGERKRAMRALDNLLLRIQEAERDLERAQARLEGLFPMRVVWKKKTCGKDGCRCARGALTGEFRERRARLEQLMGHLDEAVEVMRG